MPTEPDTLQLQDLISRVSRRTTALEESVKGLTSRLEGLQDMLSKALDYRDAQIVAATRRIHQLESLLKVSPPDEKGGRAYTAPAPIRK